MILEAVRIALVGLVFVLLPGTLVVQALFPPRQSGLSRLERGYLAVALGILLLILVGSTLGLLPHDGTGFFATVATGFPHVEIALTLVSLAAFYVGLRRGAYPRLAERLGLRTSPQRRAGPGPEGEWRGP